MEIVPSLVRAAHRRFRQLAVNGVCREQRDAVHEEPWRAALVGLDVRMPVANHPVERLAKAPQCQAV